MTESLLKRMVAITNRQLRNLDAQRLRLTQQQLQRRTALFNFPVYQRGGQPESVARTMHRRTTRHGSTAHESFNAHEPLISDRGYTRGSAAPRYVDQ
jgi:hypothetical protein